MKYRAWIDYKDGSHKEESGLTYEAGLALRAQWEALGAWEDAGVALIEPLPKQTTDTTSPDKEERE